MTITEALAEIKTIGARIEKKRQFIKQYLFHPSSFRDPLEKDGGSLEAVRREFQAIRDLHLRLESLRLAIARSNEQTEVSINGTAKSVAAWLVWKREVAPILQSFYGDLTVSLHAARQQAGRAAWTKGQDAVESAKDLIVNVNEQELAGKREELEKILGELDGQLSLKNATVAIQV